MSSSPVPFCAPIIGPTLDAASWQLVSAVGKAQLIELRLDLMTNGSLADLQLLKRTSPLPWLLTLRSVSQGGGFAQDKAVQAHRIQEAVKALQPEYIDIEADLPAKRVEEIRRLAPHSRMIISWHERSSTPDDLVGLMTQMRKLPGDLYKLAVTAQSSTDALRLAIAIRKANANANGRGSWIGIAMGEAGLFTRVSAPILGCPILFAALDSPHASAPGQLPITTLKDIYHVQRLKARSALLGLIGDPVEKSRSHRTHNHVLEALALDAVYVKMQVTARELPQFLDHLRRLPFLGLSVTMPLKELIIPLLDTIDPVAERLGAVNTVVVERGRLIGYNTDGAGALDAIEHRLNGGVRGKYLCLLGAGGAARAIAGEALRRGAQVTIFNRSEERACAVAQELGCSTKNLAGLSQTLREGCDILANSTSVGMAPDVDGCPLDTSELQPGTLVFDAVSHPPETRLLRAAEARGCHTVGGMEMFYYQAAMQFALWYGERIDQLETIALLREVKR